MEIIEKKCAKCGLAKPRAEFTVNSGHKDGLSSRCRSCQRGDRELNQELRAARSKAWREANKEKKQQADKRYREENKDKVKRRKKQYYEDTKAETLDRIRKRRESNPPVEEKRCNKCGLVKKADAFNKNSASVDGLQYQCRECQSLRTEELRTRFLDMYGGHCALCDPSNPDAWEYEFLSLDHVEGDGAADRRKHPNCQWAYRDAVKAGTPNFAKYRILCRNHNHAEGHPRKPYEELSESGKYIRDTVDSVIEGYGGECSCCHTDYKPFLQLDHKNGGGSEHTKNSSLGSLAPYYDAKNRNFPEDYQVLCCNCNWSKHLGKGLCVHQRQKETPQES